LNDFVQFMINGYPVLEATITNNVQPAPIPAGRLGAASLGFGALMLGYLSSNYDITDPDHIAVFDEVELIDLESAAFTSFATSGSDVYFNFFSHLSDGYLAADFAILSSTNLKGAFTDADAIISRIHEDSAGIEGAKAYFGGLYLDGFSPKASGFFKVVGPEPPP
jgi:hypothetical protein